MLKYEEFSKKIIELLFSKKNESFLESINTNENILKLENKKDEDKNEIYNNNT